MYTAQGLYGASPQMPAATSAAPLHSADDLGSGWQSLISPRNPLVIFGAVLAVTLGAVGVAGAARVGPVKVSGSGGKA
jgi:hypothetical protein